MKTLTTVGEAAVMLILLVLFLVWTALRSVVGLFGFDLKNPYDAINGTPLTEEDIMEAVNCICPQCQNITEPVGFSPKAMRKIFHCNQCHIKYYAKIPSDTIGSLNLEADQDEKIFPLN